MRKVILLGSKTVSRERVPRPAGGWGLRRPMQLLQGSYVWAGRGVSVNARPASRRGLLLRVWLRDQRRGARWRCPARVRSTGHLLVS